MTYPDAVYRGEGGEVTAWRRAADTPPDIVFPGETRVHYLVRGADSGGLFGLYRWEMGPGPGGAWPHFHRGYTETFHVLDGQVQIHDGTGWVDCGPGDTVHVPIGGIHGFRNESGERASMLLHFSPGAPREEYFERLPELVQMDDVERAAFFQVHDNHYLQ